MRAGLLGGAFAAACACSSPAPPDPSPPTAPTAAPARGAIRVPLPEGWSALGAAGGTLTASPAGRTNALLRIERRKAGGALPSEASLLAAFGAGAPGVQARVEDRRVSDDAVVLVLSLALEVDGGSAGGSALVGVKAVGSEWFLCSTAPGASKAEVLGARDACAGLTVAK